MSDLVMLLTCLLSSFGLTVLLVWPETGPGAWIRDKVMKPLLWPKAKEVLDCYVCFSFWASLLLSRIWWRLAEVWWVWFGCLMTPGMFWLALQRNHQDDR